MNFKRLLYSDFGKILISIVLGIGLATLFRRVCVGKDCYVFKSPEFSKINKQVFKHNNKCYKFKEQSVTCDPSKKIVEFEMMKN
mgnify:FL=1|tara:strand:- start:245 stop:496 length:252 start_codon:yes stop_codon:yes gene_type:complete